MARGGLGHPRLKSGHPTGHPTQHRFFALFMFFKLNKILISVPPQSGPRGGCGNFKGGGVHPYSLTNCMHAKPGM